MERARPFLIGLGYSAWFGFVFVLCAFLTFPWSKVNDLLTVAASDGGMAFTATSLRPALVGARVEGLVLGRVGGEEGAAPWLQAERLRVRTGIGGALAGLLEARRIAGATAEEASAEAQTGSPTQRMIGALGSVTLDAFMYGDSVDLALEDEGGEAMRFALNTGKLDLAAYPMTASSFSVSPSGRFEADADVLWHWEDAKKSSGSVDLAFTGLHLAGFKVASFALPETTFDRAEAHLKLAKGRAEFRDTVFESEVVQAEVEGFINLNKDVTRSTLALRVKFKVREDLEGLLSLAGLKRTSAHRDEQGWFHYQVQGRVTAPRFKERRVVKGAGSTVAPSVGMGDEGDDDDATVRPGLERAGTKGGLDEEDGGEPVGRSVMSDERRAEIAEERARLREERVKRREERRRSREELMEKRRETQDGSEDGSRVIRRNSPVVPDPVDGDFERSNGPFYGGVEGEPAPDGGDGGDGEDDGGQEEPSDGEFEE